jgi:DNA-binding NtrC family response regulator
MVVEQKSRDHSPDERELLYKVLFDMRGDMGELKRMVAELLNGERRTQPDAPDHTKLLPRNLPVVQSPPPVVDEVYDITEEVNDEQPPLTKEKVQREAIIQALRRHNGKRKDTAKELFISERTLYRKIKELGIDEY